MDYGGDDRSRRHSGATTAAHSRDESRGSKTQLTGSTHTHIEWPPHIEPPSRPTTSQYARDFAESHWPADSSTTLGSPTSPTADHHPPIRGLDGHLKGEVAPEETRGKGTTAVIMAALCMAVFLAALDTTIITTALPTIAEHFDSPAGYTWIGSGYLLGAAASTPIWGKISDIFGRKPVLMLANVVFLGGSLIAAVSVNIGMLITARVIQGIGGGGLLVLVNICIGDLFSMRTRGQYYGLVGATWAVASATGPLIGGVFTEDVSWRWCFYINLPLDGFALIIIFFFLNELHKPSTPIVAGIKAIDWLGSLLIVGGTLMLLLGLQFGGESYPWDSAIVLCLIIVGIFVMVLFFVNEWRFARYPILPLDIFRERSNLACLAVCFCHGITFMGGSYYLPLYFQTCLGATPILSGVYTLATAIPLSIISALTGVFIKVTGKYMYPIYLGFFMMTLGYGLFIDLDAQSNWAKIILYQAVAGLGVGPLFQAPLIALQSLVPKGDIAAATATFQFIRNFATAISVVIGAVVFQNIISSPQQQQILVASLGPQSAEHLSGFNAGAEVGFVNSLPDEQKAVARDVFANSFHYMWIMFTAFSGAGLLLAFLIKRQALSRQHERVSTGLAFEEEKRLEREMRRKSRKSLRLQSDPELAQQLKSRTELELAQWRQSRAAESTIAGSPRTATPREQSPPEGFSGGDELPQDEEKRKEALCEKERDERRARREERKERARVKHESDLMEKEARKEAERTEKEEKRQSLRQEKEGRRERRESNVLRKSRPSSSSASLSRPGTAS